MKEITDFILLRKGDRVRFYGNTMNHNVPYKDGTVSLGGRVGTSGCFVDYDDGTKGIHWPEDLVKLKDEKTY